jgi:hypothetical protein
VLTAEVGVGVVLGLVVTVPESLTLGEDVAVPESFAPDDDWFPEELPTGLAQTPPLEVPPFESVNGPHGKHFCLPGFAVFQASDCS